MLECGRHGSQAVDVIHSKTVNREGEGGGGGEEEEGGSLDGVAQRERRHMLVPL